MKTKNMREPKGISGIWDLHPTRGERWIVCQRMGNALFRTIDIGLDVLRNIIFSKVCHGGMMSGVMALPCTQQVLSRAPSSNGEEG